MCLVSKFFFLVFLVFFFLGQASYIGWFSLDLVYSTIDFPRQSASQHTCRNENRVTPNSSGEIIGVWKFSSLEKLSFTEKSHLLPCLFPLDHQGTDGTSFVSLEPMLLAHLPFYRRIRKTRHCEHETTVHCWWVPPMVTWRHGRTACPHMVTK